jgi:hypothetical protein
MSELRTPEMQKKFAEGPVAVLNIKAAGPVSMGPSLIPWLVFSLAISVVTAYVASRTLPPGSDHLQVFQVLGAVAWLGYAAGQIPAAIWVGKPWSITVKEVLGGLIYALVTAAAFAWVWPH